jgi:hypothetical protein
VRVIRDVHPYAISPSTRRRLATTRVIARAMAVERQAYKPEPVQFLGRL